MTMTTGTKALAPGDVFTRPHPFTWVKEGEGEFAIERWRPGAWDHVSSGPEDMTMACHALGSVTFTVVSIHRPPGYPERVFFKRQFFTPDGTPYASSKLMNCITRKFRKDVEKFPFHYEVVEL
jgi:hypothetical protein